MNLKGQNLIGQKFGRLLVIECIGKDHRGLTMWLSKCDCGNLHTTFTKQLTSGKSKSCGCYNREKASERMKKIQLMMHTHDMTNTPFYTRWRAMLTRCYSSNTNSYENYGGRGITVCECWTKFENFKNDLYEPYLEHAKQYGEKRTTLDRIDVNGNYEPGNCRWATYSQQNNNRRNTRVFEYGGRKYKAMEICEKFNINYQAFDKRLRAGWSLEDAITKPLETKFLSKRRESV